MIRLRSIRLPCFRVPYGCWISEGTESYFRYPIIYVSVFREDWYISLIHECMHARLWDKGVYAESFEECVRHEIWAIVYEIHCLMKYSRCRMAWERWLLYERCRRKEIGNSEHWRAIEHVCRSHIWVRFKDFVHGPIDG